MRPLRTRGPRAAGYHVKRALSDHRSTTCGAAPCAGRRPTGSIGDDGESALAGDVSIADYIRGLTWAPRRATIWLQSQTHRGTAVKVSQFSANAVHAFLSALAIALKTADRSRSRSEPRDLFLLVEAEIRQFFEILPQLDNLTPKQMRELAQIREILRGLYHDADLVMLDPKTEREQ